MNNSKAQNQRTPKVTIGMPVYNGEKYIREAIDSLLAQTFTDFELIISDNGSADGTEAICREYAACDERIKYVRQPKNRGGFLNFQFVLDEGRGEYFMWAAHDDVWDAKWVEKLLPVSESHHCLTYGFVQSIDKNGGKINHPANFQKYKFSGSRFIRRCKYFMAPNFRGKANPIYGMMPLKTLKAIGISVLDSKNSGCDMIFLYVLLNSMEIRYGGSVFLYKRILCESTAGEINAECHKKGSFSRMAVVLRNAFGGPMLGEYIKRSTLPESLCLALCYPFCVLRAIVFALFNKTRRLMMS